MRTLRMLAIAAATLLFAGVAAAQQPIKIGMSMPQTGSLGAGGKAALLALQMWVEDVNAKGGLLGRKVEFIVYDDQTNPALTPSIYTKLLDVDKVDLLIAPYGTVPTAPIMPLVKQRDLLLMGNFSFQVNRTVKHDKWFNNSPWNDAASWSDGFIGAGQKLGGKTIAFLAADQEFAQNLANGARELAKKAGLQTVYNQNYPPTTVDFSSMIRAIRAAKPDIVFVMSYPNDSVAIVRAVNEIGVGDSVKLFGGGMVGLQFTPIMESLGSSLNGIVNYNSYVPGIKYPGIEEFLAALREEGGGGEGGPARLLPAAVQLRDRADARAGDHRHEEPGPQGARRLHPQERDEDHRRPDPLRPGRRVGEPARGAGAVPRRRRQEHGAVPPARQAGRAVSGAVQDRRRRRPVREGARGSRRARARIAKRRGSPRAVFLGVEPCSRSSCCWRRSSSASCSAASTRP